VRQPPRRARRRTHFGARPNDLHETEALRSATLAPGSNGYGPRADGSGDTMRSIVAGRGQGRWVVIYREGDGFVAQCLDVDVAGDGPTEAGAREFLRETLELYLDEPAGSDRHIRPNGDRPDGSSTWRSAASEAARLSGAALASVQQVGRRHRVNRIGRQTRPPEHRWPCSAARSCSSASGSLAGPSGRIRRPVETLPRGPLRTGSAACAPTTGPGAAS
jgi:hypothetical protein